MAARKRRRSRAARPEETRSVALPATPGPTAPIQDPSAKHKSGWQKLVEFFTSVRGVISAIGATVVALGSISRFVVGDFDQKLVAERDRLYANGASVEERLDAIRTLSELPHRQRQFERVAAILETSLTVRTSSTGAREPCGAPSGSDPRIVQRTLLALAAVNARAHRPLTLDRADLRGLRADSIVLDHARITQSCLLDVQLNGAQLRNADFTGSDLSGAALQGARLDSARLRNANLTDANLNNAALIDAEMVGAQLRGASAVNADFRLADLTNAQLGNTDVSFACFSGASLAGADLRSLQYWEEIRSYSRTYLGHTANAPEGLLQLAGRLGAVVTPVSVDSLAALRARARSDWSTSLKSNSCTGN